MILSGELRIPQYKWVMTFEGVKDVQFMREDAPNWFHRKMQSLILGIHWRKL